MHQTTLKFMQKPDHNLWLDIYFLLRILKQCGGCAFEWFALRSMYIPFLSSPKYALARSHPFGQNWIRMHTNVIKYVILEEAIKFAWRDLAT